MLLWFLLSYMTCSNPILQDIPLIDLTIMMRREAASVKEYFELTPNSEIIYANRPGERVRLFRARLSGDQFNLTGNTILTFYDENDQLLSADTIRSYASSKDRVEIYSGMQRRRATVMDKASYAVLTLEYVDGMKERSQASYTVRFKN